MVRKIQKEEAKNFLIKAEEFLSTAKDSLIASKFSSAAFNAIQAIINANDALTIFVLGVRASTDHKEAMDMHLETIRKIHDTRFRTVLHDALSSRSEVGYSGKIIKKDEADKFVKNAVRFIEWVKNYVK